MAENGMQRIIGVSFEAPELLVNPGGLGYGGIWNLPVRGVQEGVE